MVTNAQKRATKKYNNSHYDRITFRLPKEEAENFEKICKMHNYSKNGLIRQAVKEKIERLQSENELLERNDIE